MMESSVKSTMDLRGTDCSGRDFSGKDLTGADLRGATLTGADLRNARLCGARLRGADVSGAILAGADLTDADLIGVRYDATTQWPEGFEASSRIVSRAPRETVAENQGRLSEARVLQSFFDGDRLIRIPLHSDRKKIAVLRRIVRAFALGERYTEREVSAILGQFHEDFASLRRMLVDYRFMARANSIYWRTWVEAADFRDDEL